jgi:hypothetical protein
MEAGKGVLDPHSLAVCPSIRTRAIVGTVLTTLGSCWQGGEAVSRVPDLVRVVRCAAPYLDLGNGNNFMRMQEG